MTQVKVFLVSNKYCTSRATVTSPTGRKIWIDKDKLPKKYEGIVDYIMITREEMKELYELSSVKNWEESSNIMKELNS